ncbi:MAG: IS200/IS605 family transposase [Planctomycetota bacterium]|nr:IS200/IS605 family transposase [Planctomycetota bacterium]
MSHTFHPLYYHFAWSTSRREPLIDRSWRPRMLEILNEEVKTRGGWPIRHNAMPDHAHLLVRLKPTTTISEFIGEVKGATSFRVNRELQPRHKLCWQEGYGVLTLRKDELDKVSRYIDNQEAHHSQGRLSELLETFETEEDDWPEGMIIGEGP